MLREVMTFKMLHFRVELSVRERKELRGKVCVCVRARVWVYVCVLPVSCFIINELLSDELRLSIAVEFLVLVSAVVDTFG